MESQKISIIYTCVAETYYKYWMVPVNGLFAGNEGDHSN